MHRHLIFLFKTETLIHSVSRKLVAMLLFSSPGETTKMYLFRMSQHVNSSGKEVKTYIVVSYFGNFPLSFHTEIFFPIQTLCLRTKQAKAETIFQNANLPVALANRIPTIQWLKIYTLSHIFSYLYSVNELVFCNCHFLQLAKVCIHFYSIQLGCWAIKITLH